MYTWCSLCKGWHSTVQQPFKSSYMDTSVMWTLWLCVTSLQRYCKGMTHWPDPDLETLPSTAVIDIACAHLVLLLSSSCLVLLLRLQHAAAPCQQRSLTIYSDIAPTLSNPIIPILAATPTSADAVTLLHTSYLGRLRSNTCGTSSSTFLHIILIPSPLILFSDSFHWLLLPHPCCLYSSVLSQIGLKQNT